MSIGYILWEFPALSETFIIREIEGLLRLEMPLHIYAFRRPSVENLALHEAHSLVAQTTYFTLAETIPAHCYWLQNAPLAYFRGWKAMVETHKASARSLRQGMQMWWRSAALTRHASLHGIRHFHAHFGTLPASAALGMAALLGVSFSFSVHARDIHVPDQALLAKAAQARFILACSEHGRRTMTLRAPNLAGRVLLHRHGLSLEFSCQTDALPDQPPLILAVGRLVSKKGFAYLLRACALLKERGVIFHTAVIGEGPEGSALSAQIKALGLQGCVELLGPLRTTEVLSWYPRASVVVVPSQISSDGDQDGIPNVILEALLFNRPVIASAVGGIPEVIHHGITGLLVPPKDSFAIMQAIQWVFTNPNKAMLLGNRGQALIQSQFDLKLSSQRLADLFHEQLKC